MHRKQSIAFLVLPVAMAVTMAGCARTTSDSATRNAGSRSATPATLLSTTPEEITRDDLAKLRWIVGDWRGTGGGVPAFYERYHFENEATLVVETLADETFSKVNDESRFVLMDGRFGSGTPESGSIATALDDNSISFAPTGKTGNFFRLQRESENSWKAILNWTDKDGAAKERVYLMERLPSRESRKP